MEHLGLVGFKVPNLHRLQSILACICRHCVYNLIVYTYMYIYIEVTVDVFFLFNNVKFWWHPNLMLTVWFDRDTDMTWYDRMLYSISLFLFSYYNMTEFRGWKRKDMYFKLYTWLLCKIVGSRSYRLIWYALSTSWEQFVEIQHLYSMKTHNAMNIGIN